MHTTLSPLGVMAQSNASNQPSDSSNQQPYASTQLQNASNQLQNGSNSESKTALSPSSAPLPGSNQSGVPASGAVGSEVHAVVPYPEALPATTRAEAVEQARTGAGRSNPFSAPLTQYKKFPLQRGSALTEVTVTPEKTKPARVMVPPPPPGVVRAPDLIPHGNMVPPPPTADGDMLSLKELPAPPEKPLLSGKLKLVGIVGTRAVFTFTDGLLRLQHNWPRYLTLAAGEDFEGMTVTNISPDAVTVEEDGEKQTKELPRIR